ncbi:hypothetical protein CHUAL_012529 [Chamberlinius hualienensis]
MKVILLVAVLLVSTVLCRPHVPFSVGRVQNSRSYLVVTNSRAGPRQVHVVHDPDDIDDVVEASARKIVDPHGVLDDDAVEDLIDPHDTLEDSIKRVVDPHEAQRDAIEDAAEWAEDRREATAKFARLQLSGHKTQAIQNEDALEIAEDAAERQEEEREEMYEAMEEALERHLDPSGTKGIDIEFVPPASKSRNFVFEGLVHHPVPRPTVHQHQIQQHVHHRPVFVQPITVPVSSPSTSATITSASPQNTETSLPAATKPEKDSAKQDSQSQQEPIKEFQGEVKEIAEDVVKSVQPAETNESQSSTEKSSNGKV